MRLRNREISSPPAPPRRQRQRQTVRQTRPGEQQAPTAEEEQRERNGTGLSEADQIVLNREISTVRWREFDDRKLRIRTKKIANTLEVFTTNSRKRWYRHLQKSLESKKRVAADKGLKSRWYKLTMADKALWNAERQHLEARRMKMHEVLTLENKFGLPEPFWLDGREENGWLAWHELASGGQGHAILYIRPNSLGEIRERAVLKHDNGRGNGMILPQNELHYFEEVSKADPTSVVGFRAAHAELDPNDTSVVKHSNIFMDFCCHGDLHDLISLYVKEWQDEFSKDPQFTDIETPPEPFVWSVLLSLAEAGRAMQNVKEAPDSVQTAVCWRDKLPRIGGGQGGKSTLNKSIVHFDIKPANIFLGGRHPNADREEFSAYPAAYLGDFGLARRPSPNPLTRYVGTRGFRAKEMTPQATRPCGEKTDVWTGLSWDIPNMPKASHSDRYELAPQAEKNYSKTLCDLIVNQCLNPDYNRRPDFADIIDLCEDNIYFLQQLTDFYKVAGPVVRTALMNNQQTLNAAGLPREYHLRFKPDTEFPITA